jgi:hypothetical protein
MTRARESGLLIRPTSAESAIQLQAHPSSERVYPSVGRTGTTAMSGYYLRVYSSAVDRGVALAWAHAWFR